MSVLLSFLLTLRTWARSRAALQLEILALRHQLQLLQRSRPPRLRLAKTDRWLWGLLSRIWTEWRTALVIVKPETVIAWHRRGFECGGPGRAGVGWGDRPCRRTSAR
jgi:putative transposase